MADPQSADESRHVIRFWRRGSAPFDGETYFRGMQFDVFLITSSLGRIPRGECDAVEVAKIRLQNDDSDAYERAIEALQ